MKLKKRKFQNINLTLLIPFIALFGMPNASDNFKFRVYVADDE